VLLAIKSKFNLRFREVVIQCIYGDVTDCRCSVQGPSAGYDDGRNGH